MQHTDWNTSIAIFAWTFDGAFRFQCHRKDTAKWFFKDASVVDCLWMPPENFTGVNVSPFAANEGLGLRVEGSGLNGRQGESMRCK